MREEQADKLRHVHALPPPTPTIASELKSRQEATHSSMLMAGSSARVPSNTVTVMPCDVGSSSIAFVVAVAENREPSLMRGCNAHSVVQYIVSTTGVNGAHCLQFRGRK